MNTKRLPRFILLPLLLIAILISGNSMAATKQDLTQLQYQVYQFFTQQLQGKAGNIRIDVLPLDSRINVPKCNTPEISLPPGSRLVGRTTAAVKCPAPNKWNLNFQVQISIQADVVVASKPLPQGKTLTAEDISLVTRELADLPNTVMTAPEQVIGRMLISAVPAGIVLRNENFRAAFAVIQNQSVRIIAQSNDFKIETQGKAMNNALAGQPVNVKTTSGQVIQGIAQPGGSVLLDLK